MPCQAMSWHVMSCYVMLHLFWRQAKLYQTMMSYPTVYSTVSFTSLSSLSNLFTSLLISALVISCLLVSSHVLSCLVLSWLVFSPLLLPSFLYLAFSPQVFSSPFFLNPLFFVLSPPMAALEIELPWKIDPGTPPWKSIQPTRNQNLNQHYT